MNEDRKRARQLLADSERLEKELWQLTERLVIFTQVLQAQVAAKAGEGNGAAEH